MKNTLLRFLVSRSGGVITPLIAAAVGSGIARLATFDSSLASQVDPAAVTGFFVALLMAVVNYATNRVQTDGVKKIQALVNTDTDGIPGMVTYTEVRRAMGK